MRAARFTLNRARLDIPNTIETNGEAFLQARVAMDGQPGTPIRVFDIGANEGDWSESMLREAQRFGRAGDLDLHAFEPSAFTAERLRSRLANSTMTVNQVALSNRIGAADLYVHAPGAGTNSLHVRNADATSSETVTLTTVDAYCVERGIPWIDLLKVDAEGHDMLVLEGARGLISTRAIGVMQFEYNHRWIAARRFLRDAFDLVEPHGYRLGKLTSTGVEVYPDGWDWELETFVEGNYVAFGIDGRLVLPQLRWWKQV